MLNHHSLNLLVHFSVLALRRGEFLVKISRNAIKARYFPGTNARTKPMATRATANFPLAYTIKIQANKLNIKK